MVNKDISCYQCTKKKLRLYQKYSYLIYLIKFFSVVKKNPSDFIGAKREILFYRNSFIEAQSSPQLSDLMRSH